jgi:CRP/FNR family transcriptional regulator
MDTNKMLPVKDNCIHCETAAANSFCHIRVTELSDLSKIRFKRVYAAGSTLYGQGQAAVGAFILCKGRVKLSNSSVDGRVVTFGTAAPGDILGLSAALAEGEYETTAEAIEDCQANFLAGNELKDFLRTHPDACLNAAKQLSRDYQAAFKRMCSLASSDTVANKLARLFLDWAGSDPLELTPIRLENGLTHEALAEMIGVSRETITRALKHLRESEVATLKGHDLLIHNRDRLLAFARMGQDMRGNGHGL